jgi:dTDP-N-acetylfucosamine:lipid II N-acetylfucosaminyltransferase
MSYIVHVAHDEKFIDRGFRQFETVAPGQNRLVMRGKPRPLQFVKNNQVHFCSIREIKALFHDEQCIAVIFHSLHDFTLLKHAPTNKPVVWIGWGYDYYGILLSAAFPDGLLLPKTRELLSERSPVRRSIPSMCRSVVNRVLGRSARYHSRLLTKVSIFSPVLHLEYRMACQLNPWFKAKYIPWSYGLDAHDAISSGLPHDSQRPNILIGNSASYENNHIEIFDVLERHVSLADRKLFVPLSYGGDNWYRETIIGLGKRKFGDQFVPLTDFMPIDEYTALLRSCGHVFMNQLRQQGAGNICIIMQNGGKIYMNRRSPLYRWLVAEGGAVEAIDAIGHPPGSRAMSLTPLSMPDQLKNIHIINAHWGPEAQSRNMRRLINELMNEARTESN